MAVNAALDQRQLDETRSHGADDQMTTEINSARPAENPWSQCEDGAARPNGLGSPRMPDEVVEDRVSGPEERPLKSKMRNQSRPPQLVRITPAIPRNETLEKLKDAPPKAAKALTGPCFD